MPIIQWHSNEFSGNYSLLIFYLIHVLFTAYFEHQYFQIRVLQLLQIWCAPTVNDWHQLRAIMYTHSNILNLLPFLPSRSYYLSPGFQFVLITHKSWEIDRRICMWQHENWNFINQKLQHQSAKIFRFRVHCIRILKSKFNQHKKWEQTRETEEKNSPISNDLVYLTEL